MLYCRSERSCVTTLDSYASVTRQYNLVPVTLCGWQAGKVTVGLAESSGRLQWLRSLEGCPGTGISSGTPASTLGTEKKKKKKKLEVLWPFSPYEPNQCPTRTVPEAAWCSRHGCPSARAVAAEWNTERRGRRRRLIIRRPSGRTGVKFPAARLATWTLGGRYYSV